MNKIIELPLVTAIIPSYNCERFVTQAIDSALRQTYSPLEVILVDDGSTDDTYKLLTPYLGSIKYIKQKNQGLSSARNAGIQRARGEYIAFLDADDIWNENKIQKQISFIIENKIIDVVGCYGEFIDADGAHITNFARPVYSSKIRFKNELISKNNFSGGSEVVLRSECFKKLGLFDVTLSSAEDWDMWLRLSKLYNFGIISEKLVKLRIRSDSMSSAKNAKTMLNNELRVLEKYFTSAPLRDRLLKKRHAIALRYLAAAIAVRDSSPSFGKFNFTLKAFINSPLLMFSRKFILSFLLSLKKRFL